MAVIDAILLGNSISYCGVALLAEATQSDNWKTTSVGACQPA
jgi:hypothetical protein